MGHAAGLRAGTRYAFSRDHRKKVRNNAPLDEMSKIQLGIGETSVS